MDLGYLKEKLREQEALVRAADRLRLAALRAYGPFSPQYRRADDLYHSKKIEYDLMKYEAESLELQASLEEMQQQFLNWFDESMRELDRAYRGNSDGFDIIEEVRMIN